MLQVAQAASGCGTQQTGEEIGSTLTNHAGRRKQKHQVRQGRKQNAEHQIGQGAERAADQEGEGGPSGIQGG